MFTICMVYLRENIILSLLPSRKKRLKYISAVLRQTLHGADGRHDLTGTGSAQAELRARHYLLI